MRFFKGLTSGESYWIVMNYYGRYHYIYRHFHHHWCRYLCFCCRYRHDLSSSSSSSGLPSVMIVAVITIITVCYDSSRLLLSFFIWLSSLLTSSSSSPPPSSLSSSTSSSLPSHHRLHRRRRRRNYPHQSSFPYLSKQSCVMPSLLKYTKKRGREEGELDIRGHTVRVSGERGSDFFNQIFPLLVWRGREGREAGGVWERLWTPENMTGHLERCWV